MTGTTPKDCACCGGLAARTPVGIVNRPGLPVISYRAGTYSLFRESLIAGLSQGDRPALAALRTREPDDVSIALLDAWAVAADVLTFYTERIANEHYLGTATERRSIAGQAALIGYRLDPGVSASAWLALTAESTPGGPEGSPIPAGTRVQTIPGPEERPQSYETDEAVVAYPAWNRLDVRTRAPLAPGTGDSEIVLQGVGLALQPGAQLLLLDSGALTSASTPASHLARVTHVSVGADATTTVSFSPEMPEVFDGGVSVFVLRARAALFGFNAPDPNLFDAKILEGLGTKITPSGTNAKPPFEWAFTKPTAEAVALDTLYEGVAPQSWVVFQPGSTPLVARVSTVSEQSRSDHAISARVTVVGVEAVDTDVQPFGGSSTRSTSISLRSEELTLADVPIREPLWGDRISLSGDLARYDGERLILLRGQRPRASYSGTKDAVAAQWTAGADALVVSIEKQSDPATELIWTLEAADGTRSTFEGDTSEVSYSPPDPDDPVIGEVATVTAPTEGASPGELVLVEPLRNAYSLLAPIDLFGNVVAATHGETTPTEVLGSGDAARVFQRFTLRKAPLTYAPSDDPGGSESSLEIRVNDIRWREVRTLFGLGPRDRVFTTAVDDDGVVTVTFGDGVTGARLPTGFDNVVAHYRTGVGSAGEARAEQIALPVERPLGLKAAVNPLASSGSQDAQDPADARTNAPRSVLTLGRVVSLQDYADHAADYAGVAKATAQWTWDGRRRGVHVTIAAADGEQLAPDSTLLDDVRSDLVDASDPHVPLVVRDFRPAGFAVGARLRLDPDHDPDRVRDDVLAWLVEHYAFERRDFGRGVSQSELARAIHAIDGVIGVHLERLHRAGESGTLVSFLPADVPRAGGSPQADGAEILTLAPDDAQLEVDW